MEDNIFSLNQLLSCQLYKHSDYIPFYITDPKLRHIHKASINDRLVHHAVFRILYPIFDKGFIFDSYSCRVEKGTHRAVNKLEQFICKLSNNCKNNTYALKCDISKFFDSVDQEVLLKLIQNKVQDPKLLWLIKEIINSFEKQKRKGIPLGNVTSQLFANVYLNKLDQFMKHKLKIKYYIRYCDDFIILDKNLGYLHKLIPEIESFLIKELKLNLHRRKIIVRKLSQGIDFLGHVLLPFHRALRTKTKKRIIRKLSDNVIKYKRGQLNQKSFIHGIHSYFGILKHSDSYNLEKDLTKIVADEEYFERTGVNVILQ